MTCSKPNLANYEHLCRMYAMQAIQLLLRTMRTQLTYDYMITRLFGAREVAYPLSGDHHNEPKPRNLTVVGRFDTCTHSWLMSHPIHV